MQPPPPRPPRGIPPHQAALQQQARIEQQQRDIDSLLRDRKLWSEQLIANSRYTEYGIVPEYVRGMLRWVEVVFQDAAIGEETSSDAGDEHVLDEDAAKLVCDRVNEILMAIVIRARENALHRKALNLEMRDIMLAINSYSVIKQLIDGEVLPYHEPIGERAAAPTFMSSPQANSTSFQMPEEGEYLYAAAIAAYETELAVLNEVVMFDDDDEDPIVREIDVFANRLDNQQADFYLLQYPLRPVYRPYGDHGQLFKIRRRPASKRLELTYALNVEGPQFGADARATIQSMLALKQDGKLSAQDEAELDALRFHRLHSSTDKNDGQCEYGIGFMRHGNFYITPAARLLQFRPDFSHIDQAADAAKARAQELGASVASTDGLHGTGKSDADLDRGLQSRLRLTHAQQKAVEDSEPSVEVDCFYDPDSPETAEITNIISTFPIKYAVEIEADDPSALMAEFLMGTADGQPIQATSSRKEIRTKRVRASDKIPDIHFDPSHKSYLEALCGGCSSSTLAGTRVSTGDDTASGLGTGPLSYLALSKLTVAEQLRQIMKTRGLESFSNIKSLLTTKSATDGDLIAILLSPGVALPMQGLWVASSALLYQDKVSKWTELERSLRDFVLCFFSMGQAPPKDQIRGSTGCPPEILTKVLNGLYAPRDGKLVPKVAPDPAFEKAYVSICEKVKSEWGKQRAAEFYAVVKTFMQKEKLRTMSTAGGTEGSRLDILDPVRVRRAVEGVLREKGASTETHILEKVQKHLTNQIEVDIKDALSAVSNTVSERSHLLERRAKQCTANDELEANDLLPILSECAEKFMELWILKKSGDERDAYRKVLIDLYKADPQRGVTKRDFLQECVNKKHPCTLTDVASRQIFREVAVLIEGYWYYKASEKVQQII